MISNQSSHSLEWLSKLPAQRPRLAFLGRWMSPVRMQLLRIKQWIFGPPQAITINGMVFELSPVAISDLASYTRGFTNADGARGFIIENSGRFRDELLVTASARKPTNNLLSSPRIMTADGMQAQMASYITVRVGSSTTNQMAEAGWWLDICPRVHGRSIDLSCFLTQTELVHQRISVSDVEVTNIGFIRTNAALGARVRIPENGSLFLLSPANPNGYAIGVMLSPTAQRKP